MDPKPIAGAKGQKLEGCGQTLGKPEFFAKPHGAGRVQEAVERGFHLPGKHFGHESAVVGIDSPIHQAQVIAGLVGAVVGKLQGSPGAAGQILTG